jgi:DNA-binding NarL/FixJ family response regulator
MSNGGPTAGDTAAGILICDDNQALRELLREIIGNGLGMQVVGEAADGNEVIVEAARLQPDVVLLDLAMPNLSGLDALPEVHRVAPNAQIIVFSGFASAAVADDVIALGATSYLEKGASPETIVATIAAAHAKFRGVLPSTTALA